MKIRSVEVYQQDYDKIIALTIYVKATDENVKEIQELVDDVQKGEDLHISLKPSP